MKRVPLAYLGLPALIVVVSVGCAASTAPQTPIATPETPEMEAEEPKQDMIAQLSVDPVDLEQVTLASRPLGTVASKKPKDRSEMTKAELKKLEKCEKAYKKALHFLGSPNEKLEVWNKFVRDFPGSDNPHLEVAYKNIAKYQGSVRMNTPTMRTHKQKTASKGVIAEEDVVETVQDHMGEVQYCYKKILEDQPGLRGRVWIEFSVSPAGKAVGTKVANSSMGGTGLEECIINAMSRWQFPKPKGGETSAIVYPFLFEAPEGS